MTSFPPISKLISCTTIQGFLKRYITLSWINWLRNGKSSNFNEVDKVPTLLLNQPEIRDPVKGYSIFQGFTPLAKGM